MFHIVVPSGFSEGAATFAQYQWQRSGYRQLTRFGQQGTEAGMMQPDSLAKR